MKIQQGKLVNLKIGGSILSPSENIFFDFEFAQRLKELLCDLIDEGYTFVLNIGGGKSARIFQNLAKENQFSVYDQHYVGSAVCNLNAILFRGVLGDLAEQKVLVFNDFFNLDNFIFEKKILVAGVATIGPSSDYDALLLANHFNNKRVISLKSIEGVYTKNPKIAQSAKLIKNLNWDDYLEIINNKTDHTPGDSLPVDGETAIEAKKNGIEFVILDGRNLSNVKDCLIGEEFSGSVIQ